MYTSMCVCVCEDLYSEAQALAQGPEANLVRGTSQLFTILVSLYVYICVRVWCVCVCACVCACARTLV